MNDAELMSLEHLPGHQIRRLQQIAVAIFLQETQAHKLTPVQFAALHAIAQAPGIDQRRLAHQVGLDASTTGGVIERLASRALVTRQVASSDRRLRQLQITEAGLALLAAVRPAMLAAQARILAPLNAADQATFMRLIGQLVDGNNENSRAPSGSPALARHEG